MSSDQWEDVEVPRGSYISWGSRPGQHVTGKVLDYDPQGGTDFNDAPCPQLSIELAEPAASISKDGERTDYAVGDLVLLNCGLASLKRAVKFTNPKHGDLIKIVFEDTEKVDKGTVKVFKIKIARGAGGRSNGQPQTRQAAPAAAGWGAPASSEPPF